MKLYNDYNSVLREKYGCKVYKIGLDGGFSCPNRDGTISTGGCLYCSDVGARSSYTDPKNSIREQLISRIKYLRRAKNASRFIAYFQAFTNTYDSPEALKERYDQILGIDDVVGISIGTRPDALDNAKLKLISSYADRYEMWIELGLQSIHNRTLNAIKRGHTFEDFLSALKLTQEFHIPVCVHVILGLPGENREDMMKTAESLSALKIDGIKIHLLHVLKNSPMEKLYAQGEISLITQEEYVELACDFIERLDPDIIIQRLTGEGDRETHVAPAWAMDKTGTITRIKQVLTKRGTCQGSFYGKTAIS